jgi:hypothetical protein
LVLARQGYIFVEFTRDCRKLVEWVREAEEMWQPLGYASADDLIARGYGLEPEEIRLAARWLELNEPDAAVGLPEAVQQGKRQQDAIDTALENPKALQALGANQHSKGVTNSENVTSSERGNASSYRVRRLRRDCPEAAERLERGEFKSVAAAERWARGEEPHPPRKVPTPLEAARRAVARLSRAERRQLRRWLDAGGD